MIEKMNAAEMMQQPMKICDVLGRRIIDVVNKRRAPGFHSAQRDGRDRLGNPVAGGVYFVNMRAMNFTKTIQLVVLR